MAQFVCLKKGIEVNGETILSVVDGCTIKAKARNILINHGIENPEPGKWYSQQAWLDSFKEIAESIGFSTLRSIGLKIPENAIFPPEIDDIYKALQAIDVAYHINHSLSGKPLFDHQTGKMREGIGHYQYSMVEEKHISILCNNPYPCDFDRGIIEAMAKKFKPEGCLLLRITHDDTAPCRKKGDDTCTYHVKW